MILVNAQPYPPVPMYQDLGGGVEIHERFPFANTRLACLKPW